MTARAGTDFNTMNAAQKGGILILTGAFGAGHICVADALIAQLSEKCALPATRVDLPKLLLPRYSTMIYNAFHRMVHEAPGLYNLGYKHTGGRLGNAQILLHTPAVRSVLLQGFDRLLTECEPLLLVSVIPYAGKLYDLYRQETGCDIPLCTCITDAIAHASWLSERCERYLVACESVRESLMGAGIVRERIAVTGVPVRPPFLSPRHEAPRTPESPKRLLIMGGGWGLMRYNARFYRSLEAVRGLEVTVLTGSNKELLEELQRRYPAIRAVGYTDQVHEYMSRSDLLLTKPGGVTVFEAIHSELPLLVEPPVLAQERHNAAMIQEKGIGRVLDEGEDPLAAIGWLLHGGGIEQYLRNLRRMKEELSKSSPADELLSITRAHSAGLSHGKQCI